MDVRVSRVLLGVLAFVPFAAVFAIAFWIAWVTRDRPEIIVEIGGIVLRLPALTIPELIRVAIAVVATAIAQVLIAIPFILHSGKNPRLSANMRVVWALLFVFVGEFADPIYWGLHVRARA